MTCAIRPQLLRSAALACLFATAACGGGGGGGGIGNTPTPTPGPTPTPAPAPTPAPTPTPSSNDTAEYRATIGAVSANALAAYDRAATGAGITVGVIDSGIDLQSEEFGNRINPNSASTAGNGTVDDEGGHGTAVSFTIAGRRNGAGTHGIAFDALADRGARRYAGYVRRYLGRRRVLVQRQCDCPRPRSGTGQRRASRQHLAWRRCAEQRGDPGDQPRHRGRHRDRHLGWQ